MFIAVLTVKLRMSWVHSLKEKRMVVKSLLTKTRNHFNISAAEVEEQDIHQIAVLGFAAITGSRAQADSMLDNVTSYIEENTDAELIELERDIIVE